MDNLQPILPISGKIYTFKQNAAIGEHIIIESVKEIKRKDSEIQLKDLKNFLAENNGIKLYRSDYRIGYLGNKESDWIELQQFRTKGQQWYRFDLGNTLGYVSLTDENQKYIREISSRLDIIQNDTSEAFKMVINVIFNKLFYELNRSANNILRTVFEQNGLLGVSLKNQMKKNLNEIVNATSKTKSVSYKLQKAINMVKEITETITHELDSVCKTSKASDVVIHFDFMKEYFIEKKDVGVFNKHINPIRRSYDAISNKMSDVGNLYNFLEKTFIRKGTYDEFEYQNISEIVNNIEENLLQLHEEKIHIECNTNDLEWFVPKGVLIHVFYNLFINAAYWIDRRRKYAIDDISFAFDENDKIVVEAISDEEIVIYDTGTGVIKNMEDILFQPLESGKPNREGRGMGLYIVQQLMRSFSADIQLLDERNRYGNKYKFLLIINCEDK